MQYISLHLLTWELHLYIQSSVMWWFRGSMTAIRNRMWQFLGWMSAMQNHLWHILGSMFANQCYPLLFPSLRRSKQIQCAQTD